MTIEHNPGKTNVVDYLSRIPVFNPTVSPATLSHTLSLIADPESRDVAVQYCLDRGIDADVAIQALYSSLKSGTPVCSIDCSFCSFPHLDQHSHAIKKHKKHKGSNCQQYFSAFFGAGNPLAVFAPHLHDDNIIFSKVLPSKELITPIISNVITICDTSSFLQAVRAAQHDSQD